MITRDMGIDLGTANVLVYVRHRGIVVREPSVVAVDRKTGDIWVGTEAQKMLGRTPGEIVASRPLRGGVIADYTITKKMIAYFIRTICGKWSLIKPTLVLSVPTGGTSVERQSVFDVAKEAGARHAILLDEPLAAAIGAGLPIGEPGGNMIVDIGGGTTDVAVISLGGIVVSDSMRVAGSRMDECIMRYIKRDYNLMVGERTAEELKLRIGSAWPMEPETTLEVRGRDLVAGMPKTVVVRSADIRDALREPVSAIVDRVRHVLEQTPPELASDIIERGITLTGGGALLRGLDKLIAEQTGIPTRVADDPLTCVALGTGKVVNGEYPLRSTSARR